MKNQKRTSGNAPRAFSTLLIIGTLLSIPFSTPGQSLIPILPFFVSPCEQQIQAIADTAGKYQQLYENERQISSGWQQVYQLEKRKFEQADTYGQKRTGELTVAIGQRNTQSDRADRAEQALLPVQSEVDRLRGRTWAGRLLRKGRDVLAVVGGVVIVIGVVSTAR